MQRIAAAIVSVFGMHQSTRYTDNSTGAFREKGP
ncbi:hypothetical protein K788_00009480 (plasmid) [Paraburkholderia caribensis MBA4]|uniref:Uncharacterized protein n=1 Tax=Paraburkholderia caribensis MBA4 TaxID=1323664 RepID=A0A0P0RQS2_9BURK|nr:hypothetical protein K788_00009480 [Paraburkholderia caribensis MBA4]